MKNGKSLNRPKSGKPFILKPLKNPFKIINNENIKNNNLFSNNDNNINILTQNGKKEKINLNKLNEKGVYYDSLLNNMINYDDINEKKEKLKNINLIEKDNEDYDQLYNWSNIINNARPISAYTTLNNRTSRIENNKKEIDLDFQKKEKNLKHTEIEYYHKNNKYSNSKIPKSPVKKKIQRIRPISTTYSPRNSLSLYSFSKTINDYYKQNLKTFSERLKPKLKSNSFKLKNQIKTQRILSARKEKELNKKRNIEEIKLEKKDLIMAKERKNPIPLLKSIFSQTYSYNDNQGTIKENANKINNIIINSNKTDIINNNNYYYKNSCDSNLNEEKKLILSYYNKNDYYLQIFNRLMVDNNIKCNNDIYKNNNIEKNNEIIYNPILQNFDNNFNQKKLMTINENKSNTLNSKKEENLKNIKNIRPKTGFRQTNSIINNPWKKRPQTSNIRKYNNEIYMNNEQKEGDNLLYEISFNNEGLSENGYSSSNSLPIKTISNIGNTSYDKINKMIKERKFGLNNLKNNYYNQNKELYGQQHHHINKKKINKKNLSCNKIYNSNQTMNNKENNKWNGYSNKNKKDINIYNFGDIIDNLLLKKNKTNKNEDLYSLNYYKNIGGKFYSSSNNVNVKKNRDNINKIRNNLNPEYRYSKDDPESKYIDESISSKAISSYLKI